MFRLTFPVPDYFVALTSYITVVYIGILWTLQLFTKSWEYAPAAVSIKILWLYGTDSTDSKSTYSNLQITTRDFRLYYKTIKSESNLTNWCRLTFCHLYTSINSIWLILDLIDSIIIGSFPDRFINEWFNYF